MSAHTDSAADLELSTACPSVTATIKPKSKDIGAFDVRRALPDVAARSVGPFVFFDQMGPAAFKDDHFLDVRPHPHIGLSTITWMLEGEIMHRDSLGYVQAIRPGEVNWMTAGSGIVHSERSPEAERVNGKKVFGIQTWVALPKEHEEMDPSFQHYTADQIPWIEGDGAKVALIIGEAWGQKSPVATMWETLYADIALNAGATITLPRETEERAIYILSGCVRVDNTDFESGQMLVLRPGADIDVLAGTDARMMLCGGAALDGPRHMYWNFVSSSKERIEQAKEDWREGRFAKVPGETEFIPLPD